MKGYSLTEAKDEDEVFSAEKYRTEFNTPKKVKGPSGMNYLVRLPSSETIQEMIIGASGSDFKDDKKNMALMETYSHQYLPAIIVQPKVKRKEDGVEKSPDYLFVEELAFQDRLAIITWAISGKEILPVPEEIEADTFFPEKPGGAGASESSRVLARPSK